MEVMPSSSKEKMNRVYTYVDNNTPEKAEVFTCTASDIMEADKMYKEETGNDPRKQSHIGCSFEDVNENEL